MTMVQLLPYASYMHRAPQYCPNFKRSARLSASKGKLPRSCPTSLVLQVDIPPAGQIQRQGRDCTTRGARQQFGATSSYRLVRGRLKFRHENLRKKLLVALPRLLHSHFGVKDAFDRIRWAFGPHR